MQPKQQMWSGVALLAASALALLWANTPLAGAYRGLFGPTVLHVLNDGLMTLFFLVAGMEIKRALAPGGDLDTRGKAALPLLAAAGGMAVPAAIYASLNAGGPGAAGWGIPVATDIAFALGILALLGPRVPRSLFVFLTALAIFDDLGAILVIAVFYGGVIRLVPLLVAVGLTALLFALPRFGVRRAWPYLVAGAGLWAALHHSGIHSTMAGVILGLALPVGALRPPERLVGFAIVPLFALANAGVALGGETGPITLGVALGLAAGKPIGVFGATWLSVKLGVAPRPAGSRWIQVLGVALLAGVGFTMSLFVAALAFGAGEHMNAAKLGILFGSLVSGLAGAALLGAVSSSPSGSASDPSRAPG